MTVQGGGQQLMVRGLVGEWCFLVRGSDKVVVMASRRAFGAIIEVNVHAPSKSGQRQARSLTSAGPTSSKAQI